MHLFKNAEITNINIYEDFDKTKTISGEYARVFVCRKNKE